MPFGPEKTSVNSIDVGTIVPGHRLAIELAYTVAGAHVEGLVTVWPLPAPRPGNTECVKVSADAVNWPSSDLIARGSVFLPAELRVGEVLDFNRLQDLPLDLPLLGTQWRTAFSRGAVIQRLTWWPEPTFQSIELFQQPPGSIVRLRGEDAEVALFTTTVPGALVSVDSKTSWTNALTAADLQCDSVATLGRPFRWRSGRIANVIAIATAG